MAGGAKKPVNIFRLKNLGEPKEVFNWRLWFAVLSFGLMGAARGIDEGLISGAFNSKDFQRYINYSSYSKVEQTNIKANVSAMVQIGSVGGALFAFLVCDRIGRIWATRQLCIIWLIGIAIFMANNGHLGAVYAGRFIAGLGVGQTVVVAAFAPAAIRGLCTCVFTGFVYLGIVLAYFTNYGCQVNMGDHTHKRWEVPTSLHIIFAGLIFLLSFLQCESPRYLIKRGKVEQAIANLSRLRNLSPDHEYLVREITAIQTAHEIEMEATRGTGPLGMIKETLLIPSNLYRVYLALMAQILSQWSGAGSITLYAPDLFKLLGVRWQQRDSASDSRLWYHQTGGSHCMCSVPGRCHRSSRDGCGEGFQAAPSKKGASEGAIAMIYVSGFGWALGWNSMQYLLTAELFPLRIRALCTSLAMTLHFANQYGNSRAVPNMLLPVAEGGISPKGTFWCFAAITIIGGIWVWFSIPETAGRSLESMDRLFELPWYKIGRYGNQDADERDQVIDEKMEAMTGQQGTVQHVERNDVSTKV
ncbi:hypothetical protein POX_g09360 [Penicillium oxalicum]|uniref:hypothetical protein n=1 Tax=Penicillium oxalicum TaxID=69781 RepID=UPI0020B75A72|nr:hypothetical protein POX_g09360 [Penicillium oxalicum]KAI2786963.1 hypothetical protein POX_g09360 [Penicillium oxalicum]